MANIPVYLIQKQYDVDGNVMSPHGSRRASLESDNREPLISLTYSTFPKDNTRAEKQITSLKLMSVRVIVVLDLCVQMYDIFVGSIPTGSAGFY